MTTFNILPNNVILAQLAQVGIDAPTFEALDPATRIQALRAVASAVYTSACETNAPIGLTAAIATTNYYQTLLARLPGLTATNPPPSPPPPPASAP